MSNHNQTYSIHPNLINHSNLSRPFQNNPNLFQSIQTYINPPNLHFQIYQFHSSLTLPSIIIHTYSYAPSSTYLFPYNPNSIASSHKYFLILFWTNQEPVRYFQKGFPRLIFLELGYLERCHNHLF